MNNEQKVTYFQSTRCGPARQGHSYDTYYTLDTCPRESIDGDALRHVSAISYFMLRARGPNQHGRLGQQPIVLAWQNCAYRSVRSNNTRGGWGRLR